MAGTKTQRRSAWWVRLINGLIGSLFGLLALVLALGIGAIAAYHILQWLNSESTEALWRFIGIMAAIGVGLGLVLAFTVQPGVAWLQRQVARLERRKSKE